MEVSNYYTKTKLDELTKSEDTQTSSASTTTNTTNNEKRA